ncbi:hypothetical protein [Lentzea sp. NPDC060358]|uniref:hypothetical protein n=1 Tax=Lentzea sp. NPDC060358 TaxID=3347103 RepID=UPI003669460E
MTELLPPVRDLPPGRHTRIRAEIERAAGRRRGRLVPVLAGAAAVAAVVTSVLLLQPPPEPTPAVHVTSAPPAPLPPEEVKAVEEGCSSSAGTGQAKLRQYRDEETRWALLYSGNAALTCTIGAPDQQYNSGFAQTAIGWLPGHFSLDTVSASVGGDRDGRPGFAGRPGYRTIVGRVDGQVTRVAVEVDGRTLEAGVAAGTFAVRVYYPPDWQIPVEDGDITVRAYDANGALLGDSSDLAKSCWADPQTGAVLYGDTRGPRDQCLPASPWK